MRSRRPASLLRQFANLAVPTVCAAWIFCVHSVISGVFVGRHVGADALAAVNLLTPLLYLPYAFSVMIGVGGSTLVARLLGERKRRDAAAAFTQSLWLLAATGVSFAVAIHFGAAAFVGWTGAQGQLNALAQAYLHAYAPFVVFSTACYALELFLRVEGAPQFGLACLIGGAIADVALTWLLVGHWGLGMRGAALATGISQAIPCLPMLAYHFIAARDVRPLARAFATCNYAWRIAYNGASEFLAEIAPSVTIFAFNRVVLHLLGNTGLVAFAIVEYMTMIAAVTMVALVQSMQPIVSFQRGAGNRAAMSRAFVIGAAATTGFACIAALAALTQAQPLGALFVPANAAAQAVLSEAVPWCALAFVPAALNLTIAGYLTAIEAPLASMIIALLRSWMLLLGLLWLLTQWLGERGIWMTAAATEMATLAASIWIYRATSAARERERTLPASASADAAGTAESG
ncbi:MAG TPA: MATE family efflux transporter [Paraburkholderia sp.]|nr:MATE family efflux transporter [Paraburkholderia sp.]